MRFPAIPRLAFLLLTVPLLCRASGGGLTITSPDFASGANIPARFTCKGDDTSPTLQISGVPASAKSLVLIVDDPDAPAGTFTHWLVGNLPPGTKLISAGSTPSGGLEGTNDFGTAGYSGPCPPSGTHRYFFRLFALNSVLELPAGASRAAWDAAIRGHVIAQTFLLGRFSKADLQ
jgi:Raf kinase inhibitor-like YbhB/YbcL family protein